jgi:xylulokinase
MEGVVYSLKDSLDLVRDLGLPIKEIWATGGAARNDLWRQLQADVFGMPIHHNQVNEGPALGAALLAGVACGVFDSVADACSRVRFERDVTQPDAARHELYRRYHEVYDGAYRAIAPVMHRLSELS